MTKTFVLKQLSRFWFLGALAYGMEAFAVPSSADTIAPPDRVAVIAVGHCDDSVADSARALREYVAKQMGKNVLSEEATAAPTGNLPQSSPRFSVEEIQRAVITAKTDYLYEKFERAVDKLQAALKKIDELPWGPERVKLRYFAIAYLGQIHKKTNDYEKATDYFRELLKVDEMHELNREFPPSTREFFEKLRTEIVNEPHSQLLVRSIKPGASVYLNGFLVGKTPLAKSLVDGWYQVVVANDKGHSFVHRVEIKDDHQRIEIDLEAESRFQSESGPCYASGDSRQQRLAAFGLLAGALAVDHVIGVRVEQFGSETFLAATLYEANNGQEVREGRIRFQKGVAPKLEQLGRFVLTGEGKDVTVIPPPAITPIHSVSKQTPSPIEKSWLSHWQQIAAWSLAGVAVVFTGVAIGEQVHRSSLIKEGNDLLKQPDTNENRARSEKLAKDADSAAKWRNGFIVGAAVAAAGSGVLFAVKLGPPEATFSKREATPSFMFTVGGKF